MTEQKAAEIMEKTVIDGYPHANTLEYIEALEISIDILGANYSRDQLKNWILINKYPFLMPQNIHTGIIPKDYDYSYTILDDMPSGWKKAFGEMLCEELTEELLRNDNYGNKYLNEYKVQEVKEKFGQLRWYDNGYPHGSQIPQIIDKYSVLSENICAHCGKPDIPMTCNGWWLPLCKDCFCQISNYYKEHHTQEEIAQLAIEKAENWEEFNKEDNKMRDSYTVHRWSREEGDSEITYDISETAKKIRKKYYG